MSLRAEIAIIDDDENVVEIVKVPLFERDVKWFDRGPYTEHMVIDPDTGEIHKFTFQAEVVGQIAPKREESSFPKEGDIVRIIGNGDQTRHHFNLGELVEVVDVDSRGDINAIGVGNRGRTITQFVGRADYILE
jgi:hypothetical protein